MNTFSLAEYDELVGEGKCSAVRQRVFDASDRMRYRFLMSLFGLLLDKVAFERDFEVDIERGLPLELAFMRSVDAFEIDNAAELTLTRKGRYLLVAMMRQFFVGVNNLRDQAREALSPDERELLFGEGTDECDEKASEFPLAQAEALGESAQDMPLTR